MEVQRLRVKKGSYVVSKDELNPANLTLIVMFFLLISTHLNKIHGHKPHKVLMSGELLEVLSNGDRFFWLGR